MTKKNEEISLNQIPATSKDVRKEMLEKMREIYPALFGEGNTLNAKELQALVEDYSKPEVERYAFPWTGKTASKRFAFTPSRARLVPDKELSVDFDTTQNLIIEGENLEVLKLLQSSYFKKVKMIYIDPPYNTGHDFVYPDDYSESKESYWEKGGVMQEGVRIDTNSESSGRYHSNWLSMMQSRLLLARNLLRDDGVIFVSIDDNEVHNLRKLMDEVFGEENFVAQLIWKRRVSSALSDNNISTDHDYVVCYQKGDLKVFSGTVKDFSKYSNPDNDPRGPWISDNLTVGMTASMRPNQAYDLVDPKTGNIYPYNPNRVWAFIPESMKKMIDEGRIIFPNDISKRPMQKRFQKELRTETNPFSSIMIEVVGLNTEATRTMQEVLGGNVFDYSKPVSLLLALISQVSKDDDLILDFFAGSGTTGHAVMEFNKQYGGNRKFILVQIPEATDEKSEAFKAGYKTISQITIERVKRAGAKIKAEKPEVDTGFKVLRLAKSLFPQNMFEVDPEMTEEEKVKAWETYLEKSKQAHLFDFEPDELLTEIALKDGFDLNFKAEQLKEFKKNKVFNIKDGEKTALICLDENLQDETIKALEALKERRFICLERSVDSTRKWNLKRMFGDNLWVA